MLNFNNLDFERERQELKTVYYAVLDYDGWQPFRTLPGEGVKYSEVYEPFCYSSTCLNNVENICKILNKRQIQ